MRHLNAFGGGNARTLHRRSSTGGLAAMAARPCHACVSLCDSLPGNMWTITFCDLSNAFSGIMYFSTQHAQLCTFDHFCRQESTLVIQYISQRAKNAGWTPKFWDLQEWCLPNRSRRALSRFRWTFINLTATNRRWYIRERTVQRCCGRRRPRYAELPAQLAGCTTGFDCGDRYLSGSGKHVLRQQTRVTIVCGIAQNSQTGATSPTNELVAAHEGRQAHAIPLLNASASQFQGVCVCLCKEG